MRYRVRTVMRSFHVDADSLDDAIAAVRKNPGEGKGLAPFIIEGPDGDGWTPLHELELDLGGAKPERGRLPRKSRTPPRSRR